jgi:hypothetical protein
MALEYGIDLDEKIRTGEREIGLVAALREYRVRKADAATGDDPLKPLRWLRDGKPPFDVETWIACWNCSPSARTGLRGCSSNRLVGPESERVEFGNTAPAVSKALMIAALLLNSDRPSVR